MAPSKTEKIIVDFNKEVNSNISNKKDKSKETIFNKEQVNLVKREVKNNVGTDYIINP